MGFGLFSPVLRMLIDKSSYWSVLNGNRNYQILHVLHWVVFVLSSEPNCLFPPLLHCLCFQVYLIALHLHHVLTAMMLIIFFLLAFVLLAPWCSLGSPFSVFLFFFFLLSYMLLESHRTVYFKRFCKILFCYLFSGFGRMPCESTLPCISVCKDGLHKASSEGIWINLVWFLHFRKYLGYWHHWFSGQA